VPADEMIALGGSVLNSRWRRGSSRSSAVLCDRIGEPTLGAEARAQANDLRTLVAQAWNGRWFHRAYAPGGGVVGDHDCWLEVQPWAILCGAADATQTASLLR
jgi:hypothetical protein